MVTVPSQLFSTNCAIIIIIIIIIIDSVVGLMTRLLSGGSGVRFPAGPRYLPRLQNVQTNCGVHTGSC
jgi:hypothetical protein